MLSIPLSNETPAEPNLPTPNESTETSTLQETTESQTSASSSKQPSSQVTREDAGAATPKRLLTDEDIAALTSGTAEAVRQAVQPQSQQQRDYTPEEMDKLLHVWKPDAKWYERLAAGGEEGLKAFQEAMEGKDRQYQRRLQLEIAALKNELAPGLQSASQVAVEQAEAKFYGANKDLNPHKDIVEMIYSALGKSGKLNGLSRSAMEKTVADETRAWLKNKGVGSTPASAGASRQNNGGRKVPAQLNGTSAPSGSGGQSADSPTIAALKRIG